MKKANIFILAGQSNAVGVGHTQYLPLFYDENTIRQFENGYDNIPIWYVSHDIQSHGFVKTRVGCSEASKATLGPEVGIAKALSEACPDETFYIIKCAFGATSIAGDWRSPSSGVPYQPELTTDYAVAVNDPRARFLGWCYNACVKHLDEVFAWFLSQNMTPCVKAFCWMQGEADSPMPYVAEYIERYDHMLSDLHARYTPYFEECLHIDAGISEIWENYTMMNAQKAAYAASHGHVFIDTIGAGLTTQNEPHEAPDTYHYDVESTVRLGELFAKAWLEH